MATQLSNTTHASTRSRDEMVSAARKKLKTFRAKQAQSSLSSCGSASRRRSHSRGSSISSAAESLPSSIPVASEVARHHQKRRSHSRSASILKLDSDSNLPQAMRPSFTHPPAKPANLGDLNRSFSFGGPKACPSSVAPVMVSPPAPSSHVYPQQSTPRPRPSSHHRRRSSVSTRRESVDMMGFDPAVPNALKSIGENDKDDVAKVRERALLSLEGKAPKPKTRAIPEIVPTGFSKVEIPEWKTPDVERTFDWGMTNNKSKPIPFSLSLNNSLAGKRDSFGKNLVPSASTKAELAVLVEEEEEEEAADDNKENVAVAQTRVIQSVPEPVAAPVVSSPTKAQPVHASSPSPSRHRPATLNLKVLALASSATVTTLPTPSPTPSPTPGTRPGMKPLNLGNASNAARRQSMIALGSTSSRSSLPASRRQSLGSQSRDSASTHSSRDSLGLNTVVSRLPPTPSTMSPTSVYSSAAGIEGFLQKNQEVLITRIDQLEKALAKSRRVSLQSDVSSSSSIAEEQIGLIADLRNERNTLVEEIASWRTRVEDLERQAALYVQRVESERRESLVARERVQELERERITWKSDRAAYDEAIVRAREDAASWRAKFEEASRGECYWQAQALSLESDVKRLEKELVAARQSTRSYGSMTSLSRRCNMAPAPRRFDGSVSSASTTDVEDAWSVKSGDMDMLKARPRAPSPLPNMDVVVEEEEDEEVYADSYEEPGLDDEESEPHCIEEDEEDVASDILDEVNQELSASNWVGSHVSSVAHQTESQQPSNLDEPSPNFHFPGAFPTPTPAQGHARTGSMVKGWQMPRGPVAVKNDSPTKPDRFFDQLEHLYATSEEDLAPPANFGFEPVKFGSPEFTTFKGDGGASAFTFGSKRHSMSANFRDHGTRASRASISTAAFDGLGMPPFMNPKPEWIVKNDPAETQVVKDDAPSRSATQGKSGSDTLAHLQGQESSDGDSRGEPRPYPTGCKPENSKKCGEPSAMPPKPHQLGDADRTPTMTKPPRFIAAPTLRVPATHVSSNTCIPSSPTTPHTRITTTSMQSSSRTLVRRKPSLTRAQPTRRAPPCVPADTSHDVSRSPFSFSYSRTSSRSSGSRNSIVGAEAAAIEAAIAQAQAAAATATQSKRLTFIGLTSLLPWGVISGVGPVATTKNTTAPLCAVSEEEERRQSLVQRSERGRVTREVQLERLRRELQVAGQPVVGVSSSGPCCSRCKTDIQL